MSDLNDPYIDRIHPDWIKQFVKTINNKKVHLILEEKLLKLSPMVIFYSKIKYSKQDILSKSGFKNSTIIHNSSVGEDNMTPWMIIHNIGHILIPWHLKIKKEILSILGCSDNNYSIYNIQKDLVNCASSKKMMIPNIHELIYELFTTWAWSGKTSSPNKELAEYCDNRFAILMKEASGKMTCHRYRKPVGLSHSPWLNNLLYE